MNTRPGVIVVGVDGSERGEAALRFAAEEADRTGDTVEVVTSWVMTPNPHSPAGLVGGKDTLVELETLARQAQARTVETVLGAPPRLEIAQRLLYGDPGPALVEASAHARLLVVGSHGYGPFKAALLGSVGRHCAHHATCPVVIVPVGTGVPAPETVATR